MRLGKTCAATVGAALMALLAAAPAAEHERDLALAQLEPAPRRFTAQPDEAGGFTWWLPAGADAFVLPISAGVLVEASNERLLQWLKDGSPWSLSELPLLGARYGDRTAVVIIPWPHYAELVFEQRLGVRFKFPAGRKEATPCELIAAWGGAEPLAAAGVFRSWREQAPATGAIPRPRPLSAKAAQGPAAARLFGAPHIYLWGPALFSRHDVDPERWPALARALQGAGPETFASRLVARFSPGQRRSLAELAQSARAQNYLAEELAEAINALLPERALLSLPADLGPTDVIRRNTAALAAVGPGWTRAPQSWGDGPSLPLLEALRSAGLDRAVLLLSDLEARTPRPDVAAAAASAGYLFGPYDSYHTVHDPKAAADATWETAQFDQAAFAQGRILNADGSGNAGFKRVGYHFAPRAAWPYVRRRVDSLLAQAPCSAWFLDCDATAECFDDYNPRHPASRADDIHARRERLTWLGQKLVVGSEGGSVLFADLLHFGHGVQTPYLGHLAPEFKNPASPSFLGRNWPPDAPASYFKPVPVPPALRTPYFDPRVRLPLYRAALGDEVIASHHWNFDAFKLSDVAEQRELLDLLYMAPPLYHLNRAVWPERRERIVRHFQFWSPLHRQLATAPLTRFEALTPDRLLQRTTFRLPTGAVTLTVNFGRTDTEGYPPQSATVAGPITVQQRVYQTGGRPTDGPGPR